MSQQNNVTITFNALNHDMKSDPFYGTESSATKSIINSIYRENADNALYHQFACRFSSLFCEGDRQRYLIYLWCGMMGLPSYRDGTALNQEGMDFLDNCAQDFEIRSGELKDFLRKHSWPLPVTFFPDAVDSTKKRAALDKEKFDRAFDEFASIFPLEKDLEDFQKMRERNVTEKALKMARTESLEQQIEAKYKAIYKEQETPEERKQRLECWFREEESKEERGALQRTAKREGISRQTLSGILKR